MKKNYKLGRVKEVINLTMVLSFLFLINFQIKAQTIKLKTTQGYVQTPDDVQLFYSIQGEGKDTIVVVHGGSFNSAYLSSDLTPLAAHHTMLYYDQRATGFSSFISDTSKLGIRNHLNDIETIRKHFHLQKLNILGHSNGGIICGYYAVNYPERIKSMILVNPIPDKAGC